MAKHLSSFGEWEWFSVGVVRGGLDENLCGLSIVDGAMLVPNDGRQTVF